MADTRLSSLAAGSAVAATDKFYGVEVDGVGGVYKTAAQIKIFANQGAGLNTLNAGAANAGTTAVEYGDSRLHQSVLTVNTTLPAIAGGAALAVGKLLYTFPAGA